MGGVLGMLQIVEWDVGGDDQRPAAPVTAVYHVVDLFQAVLRVALHAEIVDNQQRCAAKIGYVLVPALKTGGQIVQYYFSEER